ncbi:hypothetical protein D044_2246A, partial [Vibrio parahaemolyticus EKP-026]
MEFRFETVD